jgi:hypothetical protein
MPSPSQQRHFLRAVAEYLTTDSARKSVLIEMKNPDALMWAKIRNAGPMLGWATQEEAYGALCRFFDVNPHEVQGIIP